MHFQEGNDGNLQGKRGEGALQWVRRQNGYVHYTHWVLPCVVRMSSERCPPVRSTHRERQYDGCIVCGRRLQAHCLRGIQQEHPGAQLHPALHRALPLASISISIAVSNNIIMTPHLSLMRSSSYSLMLRSCWSRARHRATSTNTDTSSSNRGHETTSSDQGYSIRGSSSIHRDARCSERGNNAGDWLAPAMQSPPLSLSLSLMAETEVCNGMRGRITA